MMSRAITDTETRAGSQDDVVSALAGNEAAHEREVARATQRVVLTSLGVLREQQAGRRRSRAVALAAAVLVLFVVGPPLGWLAYTLIDDERITNVTGELGIWAFFLCAALLGSALMAGWVRRKP